MIDEVQERLPAGSPPAVAEHLGAEQGEVHLDLAGLETHRRVQTDHDRLAGKWATRRRAAGGSRHTVGTAARGCSLGRKAWKAAWLRAPSRQPKTWLCSA